MTRGAPGRWLDRVYGWLFCPAFGHTPADPMGDTGCRNCGHTLGE